MKTLRIIIVVLLFASVCSCSVSNGLHSNKGLVPQESVCLKYNSNGLIGKL